MEQRSHSLSQSRSSSSGKSRGALRRASSSSTGGEETREASTGRHQHPSEQQQQQPSTRAPQLLSSSSRPMSLGRNTTTRSNSGNLMNLSMSSSQSHSSTRTQPIAPAGPIPRSSNMVLLSGLNLSSILNDSSHTTNNLSMMNTSAEMADPAADISISTAAINNAEPALGVAAPTRPRRLWKISDHALPPLSPFHWLIPQSSCYVTDASPSTVAVRIAECLRRRSVAAEYDEDAATVSCLTIDRCAWMIHLWRPAAAATTTTAAASTSLLSGAFDQETSLLSSGGGGGGSSSHTNIVVVECVRTRGPVATFHWNVQAILLSAQGLDNGEDRRLPHQASPLEYPRWPGTPAMAAAAAAARDSSSPTRTLEALEHALELIRKDRCEAQCLGLQSLVTLTDVYSVGQDAAVYASRALLSGGNSSSGSQDGTAATAAAAAPIPVSTDDSSTFDDNTAELPTWCLEGQQWLYGLIVDRQIPVREQQLQQHEQQQQPHSPASPKHQQLQQQRESSSPESPGGGSCTDVINPLLHSFLARAAGGGSGDASSEYPVDESFSGANARAADDQHAGTLRSLALRVLTNALTLLADTTKKQQPQHPTPQEEDVADADISLLESILQQQQQPPSSPSSSSFTTSAGGCSWTSRAAIQALTDDLQGASRPPAVVRNSRLASAHEACLAVACLGLLGTHSDKARREVLANESTLTLLERARQVGRSTHEQLYQQADAVYELLTETERSC